MLLRYDVKERKFENVWGVECGLATSCLLPYTHSFAPIQININNAKIKDEEKEMVERSMNALSVKDDSEAGESGKKENQENKTQKCDLLKQKRAICWSILYSGFN